MAFTTKEFPNRVFETIEEYENLIDIRKEIRKNIGSKKKKTLNVLSVVKKNDPRLEKLKEWILYYIKTLKSKD